VSANFYGLIVECLVAVLLLMTIGYCVILNRRLSKLRSNEVSMKHTISELLTATETAERAIAGLKITVRDCDHTLGERLRSSDKVRADLERELERGESVLSRIMQIAEAASGKPRAMPAKQTSIANVQPLVPEISVRRRAAETMAAAQALATRARQRSGVAA
jgi:hypothetical protein